METQRRLQEGTPGIRPFEHYFKRMDEIIKGKQTSSRVRFMLQASSTLLQKHQIHVSLCRVGVLVPGVE